MGETADMMIEGILDYETGEMIDGDATGYPRTMRKKHAERKHVRKPKCPVCGKRLRNEQGVKDHHRDVHMSPR